MSFKLTILGSNSAIPTVKKNPTAQLLNADERFFLVDCGEGTQIQLLKNKIKAHKINHIFISHLHGDHYFGLIGLINTMHLLGRTKELNLYAHQPLKEIIDLQFQASNTELKFPLFFHPIPTDKEKVLFEDEQIVISSLMLKHSIDSSGFLFREKKSAKNILKEKIETYGITIEKIPEIKKGADFKLKDGSIIPNDELTVVAKTPHSYAFCSDTTYVAKNAEKIKGVTLLYHETTFMQDLKDKAIQTGHSTTIDAATLAKKANVKQLLIGHFSSRYNNLNIVLNEAKSIFENTILATDGATFDFDLI